MVGMFSSNITHYECIISIQTAVIATSAKTPHYIRDLIWGSPRSHQSIRCSCLSIDCISIFSVSLYCHIWDMKNEAQGDGNVSNWNIRVAWVRQNDHRQTFVVRKLSTNTSFSICLICVCTQSSPVLLPQEWGLWVLTSWAHIWALTLRLATVSPSLYTTPQELKTTHSESSCEVGVCLQPKTLNVCW